MPSDADQTETLSPIDRVIARVQKTYRSWTRHTTDQEMRADWDALMWSDAAPASVVETSAGGVPAAWIAAPNADAAKVVMYFHGGGFRVGSVRSHRDLMARISAASGSRVLGVDYRLAPEHRFPAALDDACAAYEWLLAQGFGGGDIALAGDSAGGGLALSLALALRERKRPLPAAIVTLSAWTDLAAERQSYQTRNEADPIHQRQMVLMMAKGYLGADADPRDPLASPLHAALHGLPPLLMQVGDRETVLDDSRDFAAKAQEAGVDVTLEVWDGMIHVFQQFPEELPEATQAIAAIGRFLQRHFGAGARAV